jgi:L-lactate dehydrogenase complex protein LldG
MSWDIAIERTINNNVGKVKEVLTNHKYVLDIAKELRKAKEEVLSNLDYYIDLTLRSVKRIGGNAYEAKNAEEARKIAHDIIGNGKRIVMGKSMVAYEVGLRKFLTEIGNEVWETDLGEFLIQLSNEPPAHIIAPAIHMTKEVVSKLLKEKVNDKLNQDSTHEELVMAVREFLRQKFLTADVGITGANAVAADTGSIILVENEGNIRMSSVVPPIHISITGVDKIVPTLKYAFYEAMVQAAFAGLYPPTYVNLTSGPSSTGDIEMKRVTPAHGPKQFNLILVDNGRREASKDPILREALLCIRCGRCFLHCPVYKAIGPSWGVPPYNGPMGIMWSAIIYGLDSIGEKSLLCTHSGGCKEVCPMSINIPEIIQYIKSKYLSRDNKKR